MFTIDLTGRTAIITGAGRGLAYETAKSLAECGANIIIGDLLQESAENAAAEIAKMGVKAFGQKVDVVSLDEMKSLFAMAKEKTGRIDIVVNAAGIAIYNNIDTVTSEQVRRVVDINIIGTDNGSKLAFEAMKDQGYGKVVNFSSVAGRMGNVGLPHYAMTKAAVINLTQSYALHAALYGINFNAVSPGIIRTDMWESLLESRQGEDAAKKQAMWEASLKSSIPMNKAQEPIDIANAVVFLVSDQARYITGQTINVCGGMRMN